MTTLHRPQRAGRVRRRAGATSLALLADRYLGEPPIDPHPVALFGTAMKAVERSLYADTRRAGVAHAAIGCTLGALAGAVVRSTTVATYVSVAGRALGDAAHEVAEPLVVNDVVTARAMLPSLVGRDPSHLDVAEIARAAVESVAENTTDAVVAPVWWGLVGGAPGTLAYRAVNTMDAMVGHRSSRYENYGWASARLDDAANWIPARLTAALVALARPSQAREVWHAVRDDAPGHPSPNAGVAEAAFAAALGLTLGGTNTYGSAADARTEVRPALGRGRPPGPGDIAAAVRLAEDVTTLLGLVLVVLAGAGAAAAAPGASAASGRSGGRRLRLRRPWRSS